MLDLRLSVTAPILYLFACTPIGDPGDDHDSEPPEALGEVDAGDAEQAEQADKPTGTSRAKQARAPIAGEVVAAELPVDDGARCNDADVPAEVTPIRAPASWPKRQVTARATLRWRSSRRRATRRKRRVRASWCSRSTPRVRCRASR